MTFFPCSGQLLSRRAVLVALAALAMVVTTTTQARITRDGHGNVGYSTAAECDAAVADGTARAYESFTREEPLLRNGETDVKSMRLGDIPGYENGACDPGVGHQFGRDGVNSALIGKFVFYQPDTAVSAYLDANGKIVRLSMKQCDNNFGAALPRPVGIVEKAASECYADVLIPARFETQAKQVESVSATKRYVPVPATYKDITDQILVTPEMVEQIPVPATYKTVTETVMVKPESIRKEPVPPTFKTVTEQIVLRPESTTIKVIPAVYKTVTEEILVKEASTRLVSYPAKFETVTETVQVAEGYQVWKRGRAWIGKAIAVRPLRGFDVDADGTVAGTKVETNWAIADNQRLDDDVMCLVEVPAKYETIQRTVLVTPAGVREETIPAVYRTVTHEVVDVPAHSEEIAIPAQYGTISHRVIDQPTATRDVVVPAEYRTITHTVIDQPPSVREKGIPAVYKTVTRRVVDQPASVRVVEIPAQYKTLRYTVMVADAKTERRAILCETNATPAKIREIQLALKAAGFNPGPIDGILRALTMAAVNHYQQAKGLPVDGYLNLETVKSLGVSPD